MLLTESYGLIATQTRQQSKKTNRMKKKQRKGKRDSKMMRKLVETWKIEKLMMMRKMVLEGSFEILMRRMLMKHED